MVRKNRYFLTWVGKESYTDYTNEWYNNKMITREVTKKRDKNMHSVKSLTDIELSEFISTHYKTNFTIL